MSTIFHDTFSGSGALNGHAPGTSFGSEVWADTSSGGVTAQRAGGFVKSSNQALDATVASAAASIGDGTSIYGPVPASLLVTFSVKVGTIDVTNGVQHSLAVAFQLNGGFPQVQLLGVGNGVSVDWNLVAYSQFAAVTIAANTTYAASITATDGSVEFTLNGVTASDTDSALDFVDPTAGMNYLDMSTSSTLELGEITALSDVALNNLHLPQLTLAATGTGPVVVVIPPELLMDLPSLRAVGYGGYAADVILPMLTVQTGSGSVSRITLPALQALAIAHDSLGDNDASVSLPMVTLRAFGGANATAELPMLTVSMSATNAITARATVSLPSLTVAASGVTTGMGNGAATLPMFTMIGYSGAVLSVCLSGVQLTATGKGGGVGAVAATLPLFEVSASGTAQNHGGLNKSLPALRMVPNGKALVLLPGLQLTAIGTATVAVTYEAYALNLSHKPRGNYEPNDELTRFTNYPFDCIVRHKNSYFGMNSTGLYLLEGTTDDGVAIPWDWKTTLDDFGSEFLKTINSAYFAGRLAPAATIKLYYGDLGSESYAYSTPRDATAQNYRQIFGRGIESRYFGIGMDGTGPLTIESITYNKTVKTRKV